MIDTIAEDAMGKTTWMAGALLASVVVACGGDDDAPRLDAGEDTGSDQRCASDTDCSDGRFCNGAERCDPAAPSADARGCALADPPCSSTECDEAADRCPTCEDADGDGFAAASCGGDDCDDTNDAIHPGATEVCDEAHVDEDCDPATIAGAEGDLDGDGNTSDRCCNDQRDGSRSCGDDCDDTDDATRPGVPDFCDGADNDCDSSVDENPNETFCRDADGDRFGDASDTLTACFAPEGYVIDCSDCDDTAATTSPGASEVCDGTPGSPGRDENCNDEVDEGCGCSPIGLERDCGPPESLDEVGVCEPGVQTCRSVAGGAEWSTCVDAVVPRASEVCDALDDDCDGDVDESFACVRGTIEEGTNACGRAASRTCNSACAWVPAVLGRAETLATCDYCDDTGAGFAEERAFATGDVTSTFLRDSFTTTFTNYGNASAPMSTSSSCQLVGIVSSVSMNFDRVGASYLTEAQTIGYGPITFTARFRVSRASGSVPVGDGLALVMVQGSGGTLLGNGAEELGVPRALEGASVEWRFYAEGDPTSTADSFVLRRLVASGDDPVVQRAPSFPNVVNAGSGSLNYYGEIRWVIDPELPDGSGATRASVDFRYAVGSPGGTWAPQLGCGHAGEPACGFRVRAGDVRRFGVAAATGPNRSTYVSYQAYGEGAPTVVLEDRCP